MLLAQRGHIYSGRVAWDYELDAICFQDHARCVIKGRSMPVLLRRGVLASLSGSTVARLSGTLLRRAAMGFLTELRGEGAASGLSFLGFFHGGCQLFLACISSTGSAE